MRIHTLMILFMGLLAPIASQAITLEAAYKEALAHFPDIQIAQAQWDIARNDARIALGKRLPGLQLTANSRANEQDEAFGGNNTTYNVALRASQPLFYGGELRYEHQGLIALSGSVSNRWMASKHELLAQLTEAYVDALVSRETLSLQEELTELLIKQQEITQSRFELGEALPSDVTQATATLARNRAETVQAKATRAIAETTLSQLIGKTVSADHLSWPQLNRYVPATLTNVLERAHIQNPLMRALEEELNAANYQLKTVKAKWMPDIDLVAQASQNDAFFASDQEFFVGVELSMALFSGGQITAGVKKYTALLEEAKARKQQGIDQLEHSIISNWQRFEAAQSSRQAFSESTKAAEEVAQSFASEYQAGTRTILDVLNANQHVLEAKVNESMARSDEVKAAMRILTNMGTPTQDLDYE